MSFARSRLPTWLNFLLVWALLWAPVWGQWHGIEHSTKLMLSSSEGQHEAHAHQDADADPLGHEAGSELCQVLDHLAHADPLSASSTAWSASMVPTQAPVFRLAFSPDRVLWSPAQARAPPALI